MDIYESLLSPGFMINEQVARQIFELLPEQGPIITLIDRNGNIWPSNSEEFAKLDINESFLKELCVKIDDGAEPVITSFKDCSIIAVQLATEHNNCGYLIIVLPEYSPELTMSNIDLIEILLNQFSLIAKLIEKNNHLYEVQMKQYRVCGQNEIAYN